MCDSNLKLTVFDDENNLDTIQISNAHVCSGSQPIVFNPKDKSVEVCSHIFTSDLETAFKAKNKKMIEYFNKKDKLIELGKMYEKRGRMAWASFKNNPLYFA